MNRSPLLPIFLIVLVDILGMTIILPLLPFYAERLGASAFVVGTLVASFAFCQLIAGPVLGRISDSTGRKPVLIVSQIGTLIGFLILANANALWLVFLSRIIDGATAGNLSLAQAYIADVTEPENRTKSFAVIGIAFGIGFLIGPGISGFLAHYGYSYPIYAAAGLSFLSILCTATLLPGGPTQRAESPDRGLPAGRRPNPFDPASYTEYFRRPVLSRRLGEFFLFAFAFAAFMSGFALFAERRLTWNGHVYGPREVGYVFVFVGFLGIILQGGLIGRLVKMYGEVNLVRAGFISSTIGFAMLAWVTTALPLVISGIFISFGTGVLRPALTTLISRASRADEQGSVLGTSQSLMSVAQIIGPLVAGALIESHRLSLWALTPALFSFAGAAVGVAREQPSPTEVQTV